MKHVASLTMAAVFALGVGSVAHALPTDNSESGMPRYSSVGSDYWATQHHPCVGLSSGTAHPSCGSLTGGPAGGLV